MTSDAVTLLHDASLDDVYKLIHERTGLRVSDTQATDIAQVLSDALAMLQVRDVRRLLPILSAESLKHPVWRELVHATAIGETYFFRNQDQFNALRNDVLPALIDERRHNGQKQLRLWSAGCATGEEPYSLAILLREMLPDYDTWHITLLATDINLNSLERARQGMYRKWSFREETPVGIRERWFTAHGESYRIDTAMRGSVMFQLLNLVSDDYPSFASGTMNMDVILCRNVTIYFDQPTTRRIVSRFYDSLVDGGWLVVGHAEPLSSLFEGLTPRNFPHAVLYQKVIEGAPDWPILPVQHAQHSDPVPPSVVWPVTVGAEPRDHRSALAAGDAAPTGAARAIRELEADAAHGTGTPTAWQRAKLAADAGDWQEALVELARAEEEDRFQPQVYHLRGLIQWQLGDVDGALISLRQALYCDTSFALAHYALGEIHEASGQRRQAVRCWRLAQTAIAAMPPEDPLPFADDMTARMLQDLVSQRLDGRAKKG